MTHTLADSPPRHHGTADAQGASRRRPSPRAATPRQHWLCKELIARSIAAGDPRQQLSPYVIDVERELAFWRAHYQRTATWHRGVLPFVEYVPALQLGISLFLQCHDYTLAALGEDRLASRYARTRHGSRVEWHEACQAVHAAYLRLQARWQAAMTGRPTAGQSWQTDPHSPPPTAGTSPGIASLPLDPPGSPKD